MGHRGGVRDRVGAEIPLAACAGLVGRVRRGDLRGCDKPRRPCGADPRARAHLLVVDDAHLLDAPRRTSSPCWHETRTITCCSRVRTGEARARCDPGTVEDAGMRAHRASGAQPLRDGDTCRGSPRRTGRAGDGAAPLRACGGNVLFLRELRHVASATGALDQSNGIWRWTGDAVRVGHARRDDRGPHRPRSQRRPARALE